jgi:hypothetical protein
MIGGTDTTVLSHTVVDDSGGTAGFNAAGSSIQSCLDGIHFKVNCSAINSFDFSRFRLTDYEMEVNYI